jgi:hypothetical protein
MNERRVSLTRILAINWYGFRQILDVSNDLLISGKFGTGKSALLDLMQYVLLGEHWRPNRAAAGNARGRSLVSYCLCATNLFKDGEPHFTRSGGVSLIGLEFTWPLEKGKDEPRRETWGVRIEFSSATAEPKPTYFLIPDRLEWASLAPNGQMLDEESFRTWIRRDHGREYLFGRQKDYLAEMATPHHLYFDPNQFYKTFPKAIAFEPEENVEKFIREFILEENPLDVRDVKTAVGAYRETQARLDTQEDEAGYLRRIAQHHTEFENAEREAAIYQHASHALEHTRLAELVERHRTDTKTLEAKHADDNATFDAKIKERDSLDHLLKEFVLDADDAQLEQAQNEKRETVREVARLREAQKTVCDRLRNRVSGWTNWLTQGMLTFMTDRSFLTTSAVGNDMYSLQNLMGLAFLGIWLIFSTIAAPIFIQKSIITGSSAGADLLSGAFGAGRSAVAAGASTFAAAGMGRSGIGLVQAGMVAAAAAGETVAGTALSTGGSLVGSLAQIRAFQEPRASGQAKSQPRFPQNDPTGDKTVEDLLRKTRNPYSPG